MVSPVPKLAPLPVGRGVRLAGLVVPGVKKVIDQIQPYTAWWDDQNQAASRGSEPLLAVVGDSTSIGIGASAPDRGYAALVRSQLQEHHGRPWRIINLALAGARVQDALDRQLPALKPLNADLVLCGIGTNDVVWGREVTALRESLRLLVARLPPSSCIATVAGGSRRAHLVNRALTGAANNRGLAVVNLWAEPGAATRDRLAPDRFHPNDLGYELMARAVGRKLGLNSPNGEEDGGQR